MLYYSSCLWPLYVEDEMLVKLCLTPPPAFTMNTTHQSFLVRIVLYPVHALQPTHASKELSINNAQSATSVWLSGTLSLRAVPQATS